MNTSAYYEITFAADFATAKSEKELDKMFERELDNIIGTIEKRIKPMKSVTAVAEAFHYSSLASVLLQHKAKYRLDEILSAAPPEHSVETLIMAQLGVQGENEAAEIRSDKSYLRYSQAQELAQLMGEPFAYSGSMMRALVMVSAMHVCACRKNSMVDPYLILQGYKPTGSLLTEETSKIFPVIGTMHRIAQSLFAQSYSVLEHEMYKVERKANGTFCAVFSEKLAELLSLEDMETCDRARIEELRDFYLDTLCRFYYNLRGINFPRVLHLIAAVRAHADDNGCISEDTLREITPPECSALLGNESILTKESVDMDMSWYRTNGGLKTFATLAKRFNLLSGRKQALLDAVISQD